MKCIECNREATEKHHIIPRVSGGTATVPLCSPCHAKVHGIGNGRRDNHRTNIKRGIDNSRATELWMAYILINYRNGDIEQARKMSAELNTRLKESDPRYLKASSFEWAAKRLSSKEEGIEYWYTFFYENGYLKRAFISDFKQLLK